MQISPEIPQCVAFIGYKKELAGGRTEIALGGTVFFTDRELGSPGVRATYAVTARHVIEAIKERGIDGRTHIRFNSENGAAWTETELSDWIYSDDSSVDVAVAPISGKVLAYGHKFIPSTMFANSDIITTERIGVGHELYFPGLFAHHIGDDRILPIVRTGSIAAMPVERIKTDWGGSMHGYLVEARSIGGLSGSPVFVQAGPFRQTAPLQATLGNIVYYLLGLIHGHYEQGVPSDSSVDVIKSDSISRTVNSGIAIIVPAKAIASVLDQDHFVQQRKVLIAQSAANLIPPKSDKRGQR
jgi:hypothetical protein